MQDFELVGCNDDKFREIFSKLVSEFAKKYPNGFAKEDVNYQRDNLDSLALINYTSGTTSVSKGVMISYRALLSNYMFACEVLPNLKPGDKVISMLPMAHMYGLQFEVIFEFIRGIHIHFLTRIPSPKIVAEAFSRVKPDIIISVPLIIEKIYKTKLKPILDKKKMKLLLNTPIIDTMVKSKILTTLTESFGGKFYEIIVGGAAFNREVETFFKKIGFPHTVGYGMTECAPIICYADWKEHKLGSCGKVVPRMELKIDSADETKIAGEILVRGANVMMGYYKMPEETKEMFTSDGWLKTGDIGYVTEDGQLFITGRVKNLIILSSGENVSPEAIEKKFGATELVEEVLVFGENNRIVAEIYPDFEYAKANGITDIYAELERIVDSMNKTAKASHIISEVRIRNAPFEKTGPGKIKRYETKI